MANDVEGLVQFQEVSTMLKIVWKPASERELEAWAGFVMSARPDHLIKSNEELI